METQKNKINLKGFIPAVITLIINSIAYFFLPARVAIQFNNSGVSNSAGKGLYLVLILLAITLFSYLGSKTYSPSKINRYTGISIFLVLLNIFTIVINIFVL